MKRVPNAVIAEDAQEYEVRNVGELIATDVRMRAAGDIRDMTGTGCVAYLTLQRHTKALIAVLAAGKYATRARTPRDRCRTLTTPGRQTTVTGEKTPHMVVVWRSKQRTETNREQTQNRTEQNTTTHLHALVVQLQTI